MNKKLRRLLRFVRRNQKPLLLRALVVAVPVILVLSVLLHPWRKEQKASQDTAVTLPSWESITYTNPANAYDSTKFKKDGYLLSYEDADYVSVQGIDVSSYTGDIDWEKVKAACSAQGIPVGVYFFSQAVSEDEAKEEAAFCIQHLAGYELSLPVIYDPEDAPTESARTANLTGDQITQNALAFCQAIQDAGYSPGIYANREWQKNVLDMTQFQDTIVWFAGFTDAPQTAYHFEYWQYSHTGRVDGIASDVDVDMDIRMVPKNAAL